MMPICTTRTVESKAKAKNEGTPIPHRQRIMKIKQNELQQEP